jgi:hypothetical protein
VQAKTMDNNITNTGTYHVDVFLFIFSWVMIGIGKMFAFIGWGNAPILIGCLASSLLAVKTGWELYDKWKQKKQNKKKK